MEVPTCPEDRNNVLLSLAHFCATQPSLFLVSFPWAIGFGQILIHYLDEATSALDATSRLLVFEAIKQWRANLTTIVITHDLSQITPDDFVYVLKGGELVERGFRCDLERSFTGEFKRMSLVQGAAGGFPEKQETVQTDSSAVDEILERQEAEKEEELEAVGLNKKTLEHQSMMRPMTMGNWMFDVVADLTKPTTAHNVVPHEARPLNRFIPAEAFSSELPPMPSRRSLRISVPSLSSPTTISEVSRRFSLPFTPTSPSRSTLSMFSSTLVDEDDFLERYSLERKANQATRKRLQSDAVSHQSQKKRVRARWDEASFATLTAIKVEKSEQYEEPEISSPEPSSTSLWQLIRVVYATMPQKPLVLLGIIVCLISGAMTPIFSFLLSRLFFEVSIGAKDVSTINKFGGIVLAVAAADGIFMGLKYSIMEYAAVNWVNKVRRACIKLVLAQDKKWFDKSDNSSVRLMQILIKDGDDARSLIATVLGQCLVVVAMLSVGLIWALVRGWQLTLVGFAIAPVFVAAMVIQTKLVATCEVRNKRAREDVAKGYYDVSFFFFRVALILV